MFQSAVKLWSRYTLIHGPPLSLSHLVVKLGITSPVYGFISNWFNVFCSAWFTVTVYEIPQVSLCLKQAVFSFCLFKSFLPMNPLISDCLAWGSFSYFILFFTQNVNFSNTSVHVWVENQSKKCESMQRTCKKNLHQLIGEIEENILLWPAGIISTYVYPKFCNLSMFNMDVQHHTSI